jgi:competence protein ComEC
MSFQLSFLATLGLIWFLGPIKGIISRLFKAKGVVFDDLASTLAAQILVWPLISYRFGSVSIVSPLVNALSLWLIPICTVMGFLFLTGVLLSDLSGIVMSYAIYPFLDIFVGIVNLFDNMPFGSVFMSISPNVLIFYYLVLFLTFGLFVKERWNNYKTELI